MGAKELFRGKFHTDNIAIGSIMRKLPIRVVVSFSHPRCCPALALTAGFCAQHSAADWTKACEGQPFGKCAAQCIQRNCLHG